MFLTVFWLPGSPRCDLCHLVHHVTAPFAIDATGHLSVMKTWCHFTSRWRDNNTTHVVSSTDGDHCVEAGPPRRGGEGGHFLFMGGPEGSVRWCKCVCFWPRPQVQYMGIFENVAFSKCLGHSFSAKPHFRKTNFFSVFTCWRGKQSFSPLFGVILRHYLFCSGHGFVSWQTQPN